MDWTPAATALLGTWPQQVAAWGRDAITAYLGELEARGMTPEQAVAAIRASDEKWPPSAGQLAAMRTAPALTPDDVLAALYAGPRCVVRARPPFTGGPIYDVEKGRNEAARERAVEIDPLLGAFVTRHLSWLRSVEVDHPVHGELNRKEVRRAWADFLLASEGRDVAALTAGRGPGGLRALDPLSALGVAGRPEIEAGS
jgi:hypothetical protein